MYAMQAQEEEGEGEGEGGSRNDREQRVRSSRGSVASVQGWVLRHWKKKCLRAMRATAAGIVSSTLSDVVRSRSYTEVEYMYGYLC